MAMNGIPSPIKSLNIAFPFAIAHCRTRLTARLIFDQAIGMPSSVGYFTGEESTFCPRAANQKL
jgi:hypothetical protein